MQMVPYIDFLKLMTRKGIKLESYMLARMQCKVI